MKGKSDCAVTALPIGRFQFTRQPHLLANVWLSDHFESANVDIGIPERFHGGEGVLVWEFCSLLPNRGDLCFDCYQLYCSLGLLSITLSHEC